MAAVALLALASPGRAETAPLHVAVYVAPPYGTVAPDGTVSGLSVDLWRRVAERMERQFELTPLTDMDALLKGVEGGRFDAAIGAITITQEREARVDFSYPSHRSGVAVALRRDTGPLAALKAYVGALADLLPLVAMILVALVATGIVMWSLERRSHAAGHGEAAVTSLSDGLYWAVVTMTTVGYGDKTPKTHAGRTVAMVWMFGSLILVSLLSTTLVSRLTADRVEGADRALSLDLSGERLAAAAFSSGAEYLDTQHLAHATYKDLDAALQALADGQATAVVNSVGTLRYLVAKRFAQKVQVADGLLAPAYMAIALPKRSALRAQIDTALIQITGGPDWTATEDRVFGR